jgi:hypothetical protein
MPLASFQSSLSRQLMPGYDCWLSEEGQPMQRGVSVTLPEETVRLLNRIAERGEWGTIIDIAVRRYAEHAGPADLRRRLLDDGGAGHGRHRAEASEALAGPDDEGWSLRDG